MNFRNWGENAYKFFEYFGLTRQEAVVLCVLAGITLLGGLVGLIKETYRDDSIEITSVPYPKSEARPYSQKPENDSTVSVWFSRQDTLQTLFRKGVARDSIQRFIIKTNDAPARVVRINQADVQEISSLPGVGPKIAARIIEYRNKNGPFSKLEDIQNVKGVGKKLIEKIRPFIDIN